MSMPIGQAIDLAEKYVTRLEKEAQPFKDVRDVLRAASEAATQRTTLEGEVATLQRNRHTLQEDLTRLGQEMDGLRAMANAETLEIGTTMAALRQEALRLGLPWQEPNCSSAQGDLESL